MLQPGKSQAGGGAPSSLLQPWEMFPSRTDSSARTDRQTADGPSGKRLLQALDTIHGAPMRQKRKASGGGFTAGFL